MKEIIVKIKNVYGNDLTYPACPVSEKLIQLTGVKTFTAKHIAIIKSLGYEVKLEQAEI